MEVASLGNARYFLVFKDDFSRFRRVFFLKEKSEVPECIEIFLKESVKQGHQVKTLMSDCGSEFWNSSVKKILNTFGVTMRNSMPYTPEQNGVAERENRILVESARTMIHAKGLSKRLWAEAVNTAVHVLNRTGPSSVDGKSPIELWTGQECYPINHFRPFGSECFVHVPKPLRRKWCSKSKKGILVGYCHETDGYRVLVENKVITSRDVDFVPLIKNDKLQSTAVLEENETENEMVSLDLKLKDKYGNSQSNKELEDDQMSYSEGVLQESEETEFENLQENVSDRPQRVRRLPNKLKIKRLYFINRS